VLAKYILRLRVDGGAEGRPWSAVVLLRTCHLDCWFHVDDYQPLYSFLGLIFLRFMFTVYIPLTGK